MRRDRIRRHLTSPRRHSSRRGEGERRGRWKTARLCLTATGGVSPWRGGRPRGGGGGGGGGRRRKGGEGAGC
jgi:hypothetical protein